MPRRSRGGPGMVTIYWRDIPAQVTATGEDGSKEQVLLHQRFQVAIDRAAAVAGLTDTDDYVQEWRRVATGVEGDAIAAAHAAADELDQAHPREVLEALVANGGLSPDPHPADPGQTGAPQ